MAVFLCGAFAAGILVEAELGAASAAAVGIMVAAAGLTRPSLLAIGVALLAGVAASAGARRPAPLLPEGVRAWEGTVVRRQEAGAIVDIDGVRAFVAARALPGDRVRFRGRLDAPAGFRNPGALDWQRVWAARGVDAIASVLPPGMVVLDGSEPSVWRAAAVVHDRAAAAIDAPLVQALVLGKRDQVPPAIEDAFRRAGVSHVLSVSGLHLAAITFLFYAAVRRAWLAPARLALRVDAERVAALAALPLAIGYTLVTGAAVATVRALACVLVFVGAKLAGRRADALSALAMAALAILAASPAALHDVSFQLSFSAAAGLAVAARVRLRRWPARMLLASAVAFAATAPFTALHFGVLQPAGIVANLVVVPLAELVVLPLGLAGAALAGTPLGAPLLQVASWAATALSAIVEAIARVAPVIDVFPPRPHELALLLGALLAAACLRGRAALAAVALCLGLVGLSYAWPTRNDHLTVTFLDVGQGDSAVVEGPGEVWLIDAGGRLFGDGVDPGERAVWPFLRSRRIRRIDVAVVSHPHPDHYGGLAAVAAHVPIGELWVNGDEGDRAYRDLLAALTRSGTRIVRPPPGAERSANHARLRALGPADVDATRSTNDNSLVVEVEYAGRRVLFPGDVEADGEALLAPRAVDVVKVPHHGSRTSSTPALVDATRPRLAVVSCGRRNRFGFPAPEVLARWRAAGARVRRTDAEGAVRIDIAPTGAVAEP